MLEAILEKIPADDPESAKQVGGELVAGGPAIVKQLAERVGDEFGDPDGVKAKYALHGLVVYASRPDAEAERAMVAETLAAELSDEHSDELKAFIVRQLQFCGRAAQVPALAGLLTKERLCEPAAQTLSAIAGPEAATAFRNALGKSDQAGRLTIIQALGRLRDARSAEALREVAGDSDGDVRRAALHALACIGDPDAVDLLLSAAEGEPGYERAEATDSALLLGRRLAEDGNDTQAERLFRRLLTRRRAAEDVHDRCAALDGLARGAGSRAFDEVSAALESDDLTYRNAAARTAVDLAISLAKDRAQEADRLLRKVLEATGEEAVRRQAETALGRGDR